MRLFDPSTALWLLRCSLKLLVKIKRYVPVLLSLIPYASLHHELWRPYNLDKSHSFPKSSTTGRLLIENEYKHCIIVIQSLD